MNVIGGPIDGMLAGFVERCESVEQVASLAELHSLLEDGLPRSPGGPDTLDLLGHSTRGTRLLRFGDTVIDMFDPEVQAFFASIAADELLPRRGIIAVRLLGCRTATRPVGRRTMRRLAWTLGLPVFGTIKDLIKSHFGPSGLRPEFAGVLIEATWRG